MPERSFSVRLGARVDQYVSAMKAAEKATTGFSAGTERNLKKVGGQLQSVGKTMTLGLSLPIAAAGVGAVKMAGDFDQAFRQMVGLANVPAAEIDGLKESVLDLAGETGRAPMELAESLYFAASAGLDTAGAMDAVDVAARAAAAGMGTTTDVVGLVASAIASYGEETISAAEATDILTATIREGRADPEELAGSLGRVLPIAASLGVTFEEVGGTVAYMSNIIGDTDRAVTGVNDAFAKLAAPTEQSKTVLQEMGTSVEELHGAIAQDGLLGGLQLLRDHGFAGNQEAIRRLMPDMQGAVTMTALLNDANGQLNETFAGVASNAGATGEALDAAQGPAMNMQQAWAQIQVALIQAGDVILPVVAGVAGAVADLAEGFSDLPGPVQTAVLAFLGLVAVAGPVVIMAGTVIKNLTLIGLAMDAMKAKAIAAQGAMGGPGGLIAALLALQAVESFTGDETMFGTGGIDESSDTYTRFTRTVNLATTAVGELSTATDTAGRTTGPMVASALQAHVAFQEMAGSTRSASAEGTMLAESLAAARGWQLQLASATGVSEEAIRDHADALEDNADKALAAADAWRAGVDATFALRSAQRDAHESILDVADAQANLIEVQKDEESTAADVERAYLSLADAQDRIVSSADGVADAEVRVAQERATARGRTLDATAALDVFNQSLIDQAAQASGPTRQALVDHIATLNGIPPKKASELLALIDEGRRQAAIRLLNDASKPRDAAMIARADTREADAARARLDDPIITEMIVFPRLGAAIPRQSGGRVGAGEALSLVGESGPELVSLPVGSFVHTASATAAMLGDIQPFQAGGVVRPSRSRALLRASAEAVLEARRLREQAEALELLAKATTNVDEREKLREDAAKLRDRAQDARTLAVEKAEAAADRYARAMQRESDELEGEADALRRNADALRDEADAAVAAGEARAEALRGRAESLRQAFDAERQLADAQKARAEAQDAIEAANRRVMESNRQQTIAGVTTFVHGEEERAAALAERTEALERARDAALVLADAQMQLARERAEVAGRRFTELDAARVLRASLARQGRQGLISALGIPQQMALLRQAGGALVAGQATAADLRAQAKAVDANAKAMQQNSNALERFSDRLDRFNFARPINVVINTDKEITARQIERALRRAIT